MDKFVKSQKRLKKHTINRAVAWLLVFLMCFSALPTSSMTVYAADEGTVTGYWGDSNIFAKSFADGKGTEEDPYIIKTAAQLARIGRSSALRSSHYKVADGVEDLDMSAHEWTPIRDFKGSFDGNGVTIKGLIIKTDAQCIGFFEELLSGAKVKNINFTEVNIDASVAVNGLVCAGTIAGEVYGATIDNCKVLSGKVKVTRTASDKAIYAGGLIGQICAGKSIITNCFNNSTVEAIIGEGTFEKVEKVFIRIGGIFGSKEVDGSNAEIINCANTGSVTGVNKSTSTTINTLGGIGSYVANGTITIENCYNAGSVKIGEGANSAGKYSPGGILGANGSSGERIIEKCYYAEGAVVIPSGVSGTENKDYGTAKALADIRQEAFVTTLNKNVEFLSLPSTYHWKLKTLDGESYPVSYVVVAQTGNDKYETLQKAIDAAEDGDTITLLDDVAATAVVTIESGVILDLNGYTLDMGNNNWISYGDVVDSSTDKAGRLKVDAAKGELAKNNSQMPVYIKSEDAYMLASMKPQATVTAKETDYFTSVSRPSFGATHAEKLANGATDAGLQFIIRLDWGTVTDGTYQYSQEFSYSDSLVQTVYGQGKAFSVTITGLTNYVENMKVTEFVKSDLGVELPNNSFSMKEPSGE